MTALADKLRRAIRLTGPMTVADFMAAALSDPEHGYYAGAQSAEVIGAAGDFVTAPEISQMFGELIGLWCADRWQALGTPDRVVLAELGPGRGTLMSDALRAARSVAGFSDAIELHLVETGPSLRRTQRTLLADTAVQWHDDVTTLPSGPLLLVANEFFDALPIHQYVGSDYAWRERLIGALPDGELIFHEAATPTPSTAILRKLGTSPAPGEVAEISPAAISLASTIGTRLTESPGAAIIIDYGRSGMIGDSLQAVGRHEFRDVLAAPGDYDLTAHVDFSALTRAATEAGAEVHGPVSQGDFLMALGIEMRAAALAQSATAAQAEDIEAALGRLIAPDQMGHLFKALAITSPGQATPAGFSA